MQIIKEIEAVRSQIHQTKPAGFEGMLNSLSGIARKIEEYMAESKSGPAGKTQLEQNFEAAEVQIQDLKENLYEANNRIAELESKLGLNKDLPQAPEVIPSQPDPASDKPAAQGMPSDKPSETPME